MGVKLIKNCEFEAVILFWCTDQDSQPQNLLYVPFESKSDCGLWNSFILTLFRQWTTSKKNLITILHH